MVKKSKIGKAGISFIAGLSASALANTAYAQQDTTRTSQDTIVTSESEQDTSKTRDFIYPGRNDVTTAGNGTFLADYVFDVRDFPYSLNEFVDSDKTKYPLRYSVVSDAKRGIERIMNSRLAKDSTSSTGRSFQHYMGRLTEIMNQNDSSSVGRLNRALEDGVIEAKEVESVQPGHYLSIIETTPKDTTKKESIAAILYLGRDSQKPGEEEEEASEQGRTEARPDIRNIIQNTTSAVQDTSDTGLPTPGRRPISRMTSNTFQLLTPYDSLTQTQRERYETRLAAFISGREDRIEEISPGHYVVMPETPDTARARIDSTAEVTQNTLPTKADTTIISEPDSIIISRPKRRTLDFTLESGFTPRNRELTLGASVGAWFSKWLRIGAFGNASVRNGDVYQTTSSTDTTERETQLIGPGTYKTRTDRITTNIEERGNAEIGGEVSLKPSSWLEFPIRVGAKRIRETGNQEGESTIYFERNQLPLGEETISNTRELDPTYKTYASISAGVRLDLGGLLLGGYAARINNQNQGGIRIGFRF